MKKIIIFIFALLAMSPAVRAWYSTDYDTVKTSYPDGQPKEWYARARFNGNEKGFLKHGDYHSWYDNGQLKEDGRYDWNAKDGVWIKWAEDGQRVEETTYRVGVLQGRDIAWYPDGSRSKILYYDNGKLHGLCTWFKPGDDPSNPGINMTGQKFYLYGDECIDFCAGEKYGPCCPEGSFYIKTLELWIETNKGCTQFKVGRKVDGKKQGKWVTYSFDGTIIEENLYRDGTLVMVE